MTGPIIAIRPEPGLSATIAAGETLGLVIEGCPLSQAEPLDWDAPDPQRFDALLIGSANAFRHGGAQLSRYRHLPVHAVGAVTAAAATESGFAVASVGEGGLQGVLDALNPPCRLLRLSGEERLELAIPIGIEMTERAVYRIAQRPVRSKLADRLHGALVLLHSAAAAEHFSSEIDRIGLLRNTVTLAALGPRILEAAGEGWRAIHAARRPSDAALLAMVREVWHS